MKHKSDGENSPYLEEENKLMDALALASDLFHKLKETHPSHGKDFVEGIHRCQGVILHRIVQRIYPETFPSYKKK